MRLARLRYTINTVLGPRTFKAIQIGFIVPVIGKQLTSLKLWPRLTRGCTDIRSEPCALGATLGHPTMSISQPSNIVTITDDNWPNAARNAILGFLDKNKILWLFYKVMPATDEETQAVR